MTTLTFEVPDRTAIEIEVNQVLNAGYAGRDQERVQAHIDELAELGIPAPSTTPTLYPVSPYLARQASAVDVQHEQTSGEAEWALVITEDDVLLTVACDHTDRRLEVHGVAWSKNASPDILGTHAWRLADVTDHLDAVRLRAWVGTGKQRQPSRTDSWPTCFRRATGLTSSTRADCTAPGPYCSPARSR